MSRSRAAPARTRLADGGLAAAALLAVVAAGLALEVTARPVALVGGVLAATLLESLLQQRRDRVVALWARWGVKLGVVGAFLAGLALATAVAPARGLSLLAGGLVGYLALLSGVAVGEVLRGDR